MENSILDSWTLSELDLKEDKSTVNILDLPNEILAKILTLLPQKDILQNVALVCKRFLEVSRLQGVLPIIQMPMRSNYWEIRDNAEKIGECVKIYQYSKLNLDWFESKSSDLKKLKHVASFVQSLEITLQFNCKNKPPLFENLTNLELDCSYRCTLQNIIRLWERFPNLTSLKIKLIYRTRVIRTRS